MKFIKNNMGFILELLCLLATLSFGYGVLNNRVNNVEGRIELLKIDMKDNIITTNQRLAEIDKRLYEINGSIQRLIGTIEKIEK